MFGEQRWGCLEGWFVLGLGRKSVGRSEDMLSLLVHLFTHSFVHPSHLSIHLSVHPPHAPTYPPTIYPSILLSTDSGLALF